MNNIYPRQEQGEIGEKDFSSICHDGSISFVQPGWLNQLTNMLSDQAALESGGPAMLCSLLDPAASVTAFFAPAARENGTAALGVAAS